MLFPNQIDAIEEVLTKVNQENFNDPGCPVPIILQGPTGSGKSLTCCELAKRLGVSKMVVIAPCIAKQAWDEAFGIAFNANQKHIPLFVSATTLIRRYGDVYRSEMDKYTFNPERFLPVTHPGAHRLIYDKSRSNDSVSSDPLFKQLPWHRVLKVANNGNTANTAGTGTAEPYLLVLDECHSVGLNGYTKTQKVLSRLFIDVKRNKGYLVMVSATPISTPKDRSSYLRALGYESYDRISGRTVTVTYTLRDKIVPKLPDEQRRYLCAYGSNREVICWDAILSRHHCVLMRDAPKMTILDIEARFYRVSPDQLSRMRSATHEIRETVRRRTFVDRNGDELIRLDLKTNQSIAQCVKDLEAMKARYLLPVIAARIIREDPDPCAKCIFYVNSPETAKILYESICAELSIPTNPQAKPKASLKRKHQEVLETDTKGKSPEIISPYRGILATSSLSQGRRVRICSEFNEDVNVRFFIATYSSYAPSINLQDKHDTGRRYTFLLPTLRFNNLDQAAGRTWRPGAMTDSVVRMVFVEGLEEELALLDKLSRRKAIQDNVDLGKLYRPPLPGEYTLRNDHTNKLMKFTAAMFGTAEITARKRRNEHDRRTRVINLGRDIWTLYNYQYVDTIFKQVGPQMIDLIVQYLH